jgi:hypothetical protein
MQVRFATNLTSEQYISQEAWRWATIERCPIHQKVDCGIRSHGSYQRKHPYGLRISRQYCRLARVTISLLPDFAAARLSSTLDEVEAAVSCAEASPTLTAAARALRPELGEERSAVRWLRRLVQAIRTALTALVSSLPELMGTHPRLAAVRERLKVDSPGVLVRLRAIGASLLPSLPTPLGLSPRRKPVLSGDSALQQEVGPDP